MHIRRLAMTLLVFLVIAVPVPAHAQTPIDHVRAYQQEADWWVSPSAWSLIPFVGGEVYDPNENFEAGIYTVPYDGFFLFCTRVEFKLSNWEWWQPMYLALRVDSAIHTQLNTFFPGVTADQVSFISGCAELYLSEGSEVEVVVYQYSAYSLEIQEGDTFTWLTISEIPYQYATPQPTETPIPTDTPQPTPTINATIVALVTAVAGFTGTITPTATITPGGTYLPIVMTGTLTTGREWAVIRSLSAGEVAIGVIVLCLLAVVLFKSMASLL